MGAGGGSTDQGGMRFFRRTAQDDARRDQERLAELRLALLVAMAAIDERMPLSELDLLHQAVEALALDPGHGARLEQQLVDLLDDPPSITRACHLVASAPHAMQHARTIRHDLLRMALSDGVVHEQELELQRGVQAALMGRMALAA
jgi:hypothetical protein